MLEDYKQRNERKLELVELERIIEVIFVPKEEEE